MNGIDPTGMMEFSLTGLMVSVAIEAVIGAIVGGVITKSWKGAVYGALIGAAIGAAIYTIVAYWPQIVQWFKTFIQKVIEVQKADRTVSNNLYQRICGYFRSTNPTQLQKIRYLSKIDWYKLIGEGFVGYGQKIWQLLTLNSTGLGRWFTPTWFDGIVGGAVVTLVLVYIYKDDIKQLFIDLEQPTDPNIIIKN